MYTVQAHTSTTTHTHMDKQTHTDTHTVNKQERKMGKTFTQFVVRYIIDAQAQCVSDLGQVKTIHL